MAGTYGRRVGPLTRIANAATPTLRLVVFLRIRLILAPLAMVTESHYSGALRTLLVYSFDDSLLPISGIINRRPSGTVNNINFSIVVEDIHL